MSDPGQMDMSERMIDRRSDYNAATSDRLRRLVGTGIAREADYSFRNQEAFFSLVATSRHWEENEPLLRPAIRRLVSNVSPSESRPDPQPLVADEAERKYLEAAILDEWQAWAAEADRVDIAGEHDWASMSDVVFGRTVIDGDIWGKLVDDEDHVQVFEAPEIRTPYSRQGELGVAGVVKNTFGKKTHAWVSPIDSMAGSRQYYKTEIHREDGGPQLLQLYFPQYSLQSRGIPGLAGVAEKNGMRDDLEFAMLVKQQVSACLTYFEEIDPLAWRSYLEAASAAGKNEEINERYFGRDALAKPKKVIEPTPGMTMRGIPGTKWTGFQPAIPSDGHFEQIKMLLTYLSINLDLPLILLLLDASDTTYSSYRHVVEQGRLGFRRLIGQFHSRWARPIFRWRVSRSKNPRIQAAIQTYGLRAVAAHHWIPKVQPWIDPAKDIASASAELGHGMTSPSRFANARLGMEWRQYYPELIGDWGEAVEFAMRRAAKINGLFPDMPASERVSWRELLKMPSPEGIRINLGQEKDPRQSSNSDADPRQPAKTESVL